MTDRWEVAPRDAKYMIVDAEGNIVGMSFTKEDAEHIVDLNNTPEPKRIAEVKRKLAALRLSLQKCAL